MYFLNVHGYQGHSGNNVFQMLKACFPEVEIISPQLVNKPSIDFSTLKRIIINKLIMELLLVNHWVVFMFAI